MLAQLVSLAQLAALDLLEHASPASCAGPLD